MNSFERFSADDLKALREELLQSGLDSFQSAELLAGFLSVRGYGVSNVEARTAAGRIEARGCSIPKLQEELEKLAFVM
jgi:DNA repair protein RadC